MRFLNKILWALMVAIGCSFLPDNAFSQDNQLVRGHTFFLNYCFGCHAATAGCSSLGTRPLGTCPESRLQEKINQFPAPTGMTLYRGPAPKPDATTSNTIINPTIADIYSYLQKQSFAAATILPGSADFSNAVELGTPFQDFAITNPGTSQLSLSFPGNPQNYEVSQLSPACTSAVGAAGGQCLFRVTFVPQGVVPSSTQQYLVAHNGEGAGQANPLSITLTGSAVARLARSPAAINDFQAVAQGHQAKTVMITVNTSDRIRTCIKSGDKFSAPAAFSMSVSGLSTTTTTDGSGNVCLIVNAPPQSLPFALSIDFSPTSVAGPQNAKLRIERISVAGDVLPPSLTTDLGGNAGPLIGYNVDTDHGGPFYAIEREVDGTVNAVVPITITNTGNGTEPLRFAAAPAEPFAVSGLDRQAYSLAGSGCQTITQLAAGASCVLTVKFDPVEVKRTDASLAISSNAANGELPIPLKGVGFHGPRLVVTRDGTQPFNSGEKIDFTSQRRSEVTYPSRVLTLKNDGTVGHGNLDIQVSALAVGSGFVVTTDADCASLAPQTTCNVSVAFAPTALQPYQAMLNVQSRDAGTAPSGAFITFAVSLTGIGTDSAPALSWRTPDTTTVLTTTVFPDTRAGDVATVSIRIFNDGPGSAQLGEPSVVGIDGANFAIDKGACLGVKFVGEHSGCLMTVKFAPGTSGPKSASLQYASNGNGPFLMTLQGTGIAGAVGAALSINPSVPIFGSTTAGAQSVPAAVTLTNTGNRAVQVLAVEATGPFSVQAVSCPSLPVILAVGSQCTMNVSFVPTVAGAASGTLRVTSDVAPSPTEIALSATASPAANVSSGGGCSLASGDPSTDPVFWALCLLAVLALGYRKQARLASRRSPEVDRSSS